jgi:glucose dehydrogenase
LKHIRTLVLILCACFGPVAWGQQPECKFSPFWAEFHKENMQRWNRCEKVLTVKNVKNLGLKWSYNTDDVVWSSPAVVNGVVYVGSFNCCVYSLNAKTGAKLWSY